MWVLHFIQSTMIRTQIQFPEEEWRRLRRLARQEGTSVSELVRRCVERSLASSVSDRSSSYERAASIAGTFHDREASTDLSSEHDRYLGEAFD